MIIAMVPMGDSPHSWTYILNQENIYVATIFSLAVSCLWLLALIITRKKDKPFTIPASCRYFLVASSGMTLLAVAVAVLEHLH